MLRLASKTFDFSGRGYEAEELAYTGEGTIATFSNCGPPMGESAAPLRHARARTVNRFASDGAPVRTYLRAVNTERSDGFLDSRIEAWWTLGHCARLSAAHGDEANTKYK